jgi:carboxymethylenebutenolidase
MTEQTIEIATPRGTMPVYVHRPDGAGPAPLVLVFMDAPGVRPTLHEHAKRLAAAGYAAALPDLFYSIDPAERPRPDRLSARDPEEFARMRDVVGRLRDDDLIEDTELLLEALPEADAPWGCVGFCMGGRLGLRAAARFGDRVAAASLLHPSRLVTDQPDSPHRDAAAVRADLYFGLGAKDHVTPPEAIEPLLAVLRESGDAFEVDVLADAEHGYTMPDMPAYNEAAAERAWSRTLALFSEQLGGVG